MAASSVRLISLLAAICTANAAPWDFVQSGISVLSAESEVDASPWRQHNARVQNLKPVYRSEDDHYDVAAAQLIDDKQRVFGDTYVLQKKEDPSRIITVTHDDTGVWVAVPDLTTRSTGGVRIYEGHKSGKECGGGLKLKSTRAGIMTESSRIENEEGEIDSDGSYVIDVLMIFTVKAVDTILAEFGMVIQEYISLQRAIVESAWLQSGIQKIRLRVIDYDVWSDEIAVTRDNALWVQENTQEIAASTGADLVAYFTTDDEGLSEASGYAGIEDFWSLTLVTDLLSWRHEIGHNAGLNHCPEDDGFDYKHGWELVDEMSEETIGKTIMCGNTLSVYSSPEIEINGVAAGDPDKADAARQWNDFKVLMSGRKNSTLPLDEIKPAWRVQGTMVYEKAGDNVLEWNVPEKVKAMVFRSYSEELIDEKNLYSVFIESDCCPGVYYGQHWPSVNHLMTFNDPTPGTWKAWLTGEGPTAFTISFYSEEPDLSPLFLSHQRVFSS
eukprot:Protomagalhaensia_wolfi_Nauph_80__431@NODE_1239_length_1638_cov_128_001251_g952_i0_p1_GENE_NODE_1239_length_1638_cov_128_001251_g952_i0NODE_1239_length_1638_cov_128_001251_g952_i0_p1_ORF_typecomplete_len507_score113_45Reprolysin_4/PF13583_6/5_8e06Reprolysin_3/PF13582_6/1_3e03Reprolysin_3/PF13582_6/0_0004Reprolysin_5/PF13688_6/0_0014Peptidase_M66/PF10462_9/0_005Peptidase_M11/PF05548_11/0_0039Peptidase_M54/PF07998_11/0_012Reprolysin_2/PF13574_6/0_17Peptidase_M10/PF00413_24/0_79_NODE_1239_length_16